MNQKGFANLIVIGIVLAIVLGVGGYFVLRKPSPVAPTTSSNETDTNLPPTDNSVSPTSSSSIETSNWETYKSDTGGWEVKHPPTTPYRGWTFGFSVPKEKELGQDFMNFVRAQRQSQTTPYSTVAKIYDVKTLNGHKMIRVDTLTDYGSKINYYFVEKDSKTFILINTNFDPQKIGEREPEINLMISSFKFIQ